MGNETIKQGTEQEQQEHIEYLEGYIRKLMGEIELSDEPAEKVSAFDRQEGGTHYKDCAIQPVQFCQANNIAFMEANAIKYLVRHQSKGQAADLRKALHYVQMAIEHYYPETIEA